MKWLRGKWDLLSFSNSRRVYATLAIILSILNILIVLSIIIRLLEVGLSVSDDAQVFLGLGAFLFSPIVFVIKPVRVYLSTLFKNRWIGIIAAQLVMLLVIIFGQNRLLIAIANEQLRKGFQSQEIIAVSQYYRSADALGGDAATFIGEHLLQEIEHTPILVSLVWVTAQTQVLVDLASPQQLSIFADKILDISGKRIANLQTKMEQDSLETILRTLAVVDPQKAYLFIEQMITQAINSRKASDPNVEANTPPLLETARNAVDNLAVNFSQQHRSALYLMLAVVYEENNKLTEAIEMYRQSFVAAPEHINAGYQLSFLLVEISGGEPDILTEGCA